MSEEQMSEEKEKMWEGYVERLRDFRDLFERYIRNEREIFEASQKRNEDLREFAHRMADITYSFLGVVNRLIELNFRLVEENQNLHRAIIERAAQREPTNTAVIVRASEEREEPTFSEGEKWKP